MDGDEEEVDHEGRGLRFFAHFPSRRIASDPVDFPRNPTMGPGTHRSMSPISNFSFEDLEPILVPNISIIYPPFSTEMDQTRRAVEDLTPADLDEEIEVSAEEYACRMPA